MADEPPPPIANSWIPSRLESLVVLLVAWGAVAIASTLVVGWVAPEIIGAHGEVPARTKVGPGLVVAGTLANELAVASVVGVYLWLRRQHRAVLAPLGAPTLRGLGGTLLLVLGATPWADLTGTLVQRWMGQPSEVMQTVLGAVQGASGLGLVGLILALALVPAVVEETLFRGAITACFARSRLEAILVPSLLFGAFHLEPQQAAATAVLGVAFGLGRLYTGSLLPPMFAHAFYNMAVILLMRYVGASAEPHVAWQLVVGGAVVFTIGLWLLRGGEPRHKLELGAG